MPLNERRAELSALISNFLAERLQSKVEKLDTDDPKRAELQVQFQPAMWLEDAARRVGQIQAVTHSLKPLHPEAKGSSLFCNPASLSPLAEIGSHHLGATFDMDVVGNAAALDVYKFLKLEHNGRSLLDLSVALDADLGAVLCKDTHQASAWMAAFAGLTKASDVLASHTQAKQIYWPVVDDVHDAAGYHLLAPLYPTSLVHRVYKALQDDRFGELTKAAREARKTKQMHDHPLHEYPNLAVQRLGGTKPQNISQLNSERRGNNMLLASLPPVWKSADVRPLLGSSTLFRGFFWHIKIQVNALRRFLESDPAQKLATRERRDELVDDLLEELLSFAAKLWTLQPGWSKDPSCALPASQRRWLDPGVESDMPMEDAFKDVAGAFAEGLNQRLSDPLPMGDPEYIHWRKLALLRLRQAEWEAVHDE